MKENIINYIPLKLYRYLRWRRSVNQAFRYNRENFSEEYAKICLSAAKAERQRRPTEQILAAYAEKDAYIIRYLEKLCGDVIEAYADGKHPKINQNSPKRIWVFWWTGEETAPDIVRACIKSIRRNANGHEVVVLDQSNYGDYVTFPAYVHEKHSSGQITHAAFADLLRVSLLSAYGGNWIDATVFLSQPIPETVFSSDFYTLKTYNPSALYFSKSRWCGYYLAGNKDFLLFSFAKDFLLAYWQRSDNIIEYLLLDYIFGIAYESFEEVRNVIDSLEDNNIRRGQLMNAINEPYSKELFDMLETQDTFASKLSWRYGNPQPRTVDGELSNYGYFLSL